MAQQTICPACGAPLTYNGTADEIRCPFCDTELQVIHDNAQEHFRILSQPGPQKEVLSRPVEGGQPPAEPPPTADEVPPAVPPNAQDELTDRTAAVIRPVPDEEKQTAPGYPGFLSDEADRQAFSPERLHTEQSAETLRVPDAPAFYRMHGPAQVPVTSAAADQRRRSGWVSIALALIIGLIILLACAAGAWIMLSRITRAS